MRDKCVCSVIPLSLRYNDDDDDKDGNAFCKAMVALDLLFFYITCFYLLKVHSVWEANLIKRPSKLFPPLTLYATHTI